MSGSARLFVALLPPVELAAELDRRAGEWLAPCAGSVRRYAAEELHLTLCFLGATERERIAEIEGALAAVAAREAPIELCVRGGGAFPGLARPRVIWAGVEERSGASGRLAALAAEVARALGREVEEPFRAHLTLARPRGGMRVHVTEGSASLAVEGAWTARELVLVESRPEERPRYRVLGSWRLGA